MLSLNFHYLLGDLTRKLLLSEKHSIYKEGTERVEAYSS